jgi:hypothetical protein
LGDAEWQCRREAAGGQSWMIHKFDNVKAWSEEARERKVGDTGFWKKQVYKAEDTRKGPGVSLPLGKRFFGSTAPYTSSEDHYCDRCTAQIHAAMLRQFHTYSCP